MGPGRALQLSRYTGRPDAPTPARLKVIQAIECFWLSLVRLPAHGARWWDRTCVVDKVCARNARHGRRYDLSLSIGAASSEEYDPSSIEKLLPMPTRRCTRTSESSAPLAERREARVAHRRPWYHAGTKHAVVPA